MTFDKQIKFVEDNIGVSFSDEQKAILNTSPEKAILVNACAGSGKTTVFLANILVKALAKKQYPREVLGITFSKQAQMDMQNRYKQYASNLPQANVGYPTLKTFHGLFYTLLLRLPKYRNVRVLSSWHKYFKQFTEVVDLEDTDVDRPEYLNNIFDTYDFLINKAYSFDGLHLNTENQFVKDILLDEKATLKNLLPRLDLKSYEEGYFENYSRVISKYNELKQKDHVIDFNDMLVLLFKELDNPDSKTVISNSISWYKQVYIDEFQDIDYIQWLIIKKLFKPEVLNHLFVIGDDDQSIYGFRGSSPYFITHFATDLVPNAEVKQLSVNYRTGGNILNIAKPMITQNKNRLAKELKAYKVGQGKPYVYKTDFVFDNEFCKKILEDYHKQNGNNAVLVRYNFDKSLIRDFLAENGVYVRDNSSSSLIQDNFYYSTYYNIMKGIVNNDFVAYASHSKAIGFSKYWNFIWPYYYKLKRRHEDITLTHVLKYTLKDTAWMKFRSQVECRNMIMNTLDHINNLKQIQENFDNGVEVNETPMQAAFRIAVELTGITFEWNIKQNFYSQNHLNSVNEYFTYLCSKYKTFNEFDKNERIKISKLRKTNSTDPNLRILTVHQAKGLEFDNVYLFGFKNEDVSSELVKLDEVFSPGDKFTDFQNKINVLAKNKNPELLRYLDILSDAGVDGTYELIYKLWPKGTFNVNWRQFIKHEEELDGTPNFEIFPLSDMELKIIYHSAVTLSQALEDERRLLYVAVTRAKRECSINYDNDSHSPLLDELGFN